MRDPRGGGAEDDRLIRDEGHDTFGDENGVRWNIDAVAIDLNCEDVILLTILGPNQIDNALNDTQVLAIGQDNSLAGELIGDGGEAW